MRQPSPTGRDRGCLSYPTTKDVIEDGRSRAAEVPQSTKSLLRVVAASTRPTGFTSPRIT